MDAKQPSSKSTPRRTIFRKQKQRGKTDDRARRFVNQLTRRARERLAKQHKAPLQAFKVQEAINKARLARAEQRRVMKEASRRLANHEPPLGFVPVPGDPSTVIPTRKVTPYVQPQVLQNFQ